MSEVTTATYSADDYQTFQHREHIYEIPDTYIGSTRKIARPLRLFSFDELEDGMRFYNDEIKLPQGIEQCYKEVVTNASDNIIKSRDREIDPGPIYIDMNEQVVRVKNGGILIPIEMRDGIYMPEIIFGTLLTSTNYGDGDRTSAGRNGYGAKITNIFSTYFNVEICNPTEKVKYSQTWTENMINVGTPIIERYDGDEAYVQVTYELDFERFKYEHYPDEAFNLFAAHAADIAFTVKAPVYFNGMLLDCQDNEIFATWVFGNELASKALIHREWPKNVEMKGRKNNQVPKSPFINSIVDMIIVDTPDNGTMIPFCNGLINPGGGAHVDASLRLISDIVIPFINEQVVDKKTGKAKAKLDIRDVRRHLSVIVSCSLNNPEFEGQAKYKLAKPKPKINISEDDLKKVIKNWKIVARLYADMEAKQLKKLRGSSNRNGPGRVDKAEEANMAGKKGHSMRCNLFLVEGDSAANYIINLIQLLEGKRDYNGYLSGSGVPLNTLKATRGLDISQLINNRVFNDLKKLMGLIEGEVYDTPAKIAKLRYGSIIIVVDADEDGKHIMALYILYFWCRFRSLLEQNIVKFIRTPVLHVRKNGREIRFLSMSQYEEWAKETPDHKTYEHDFKKGLASSSDEEIASNVSDMKIVDLILDDKADDYLKMAFDPDMADIRKRWILNHDLTGNFDMLDYQAISEYIHYEMIEHPIANVARMIPHRMSGLKESQEKILYSAFVYWKGTIGTNKAKKVKTAHFSSHAASVSLYHHGSLEETINRMVADYCGSNNLPHLKAEGQFSTRSNSKSGAARYTSFKPSWWIRYIYLKEDDQLLTYRIIDGEKGEPYTYLPIIPMAMINGCIGIATGWSTFIPQYNPIHVSTWIICRCRNEELPEMIPWYNGFKGTIEVKSVERDKKKFDDHGLDFEWINSEEDDELGPDDEGIDVDTKYTMIMTGVFEEVNDDTVIVTELPIGRSFHSYKIFLDKLKEKKEITSFKNNSTPNEPYFTIKGMKNPTAKKLRLIKRWGMSNMWLIDEDNKPHYYESITDYMEEFFQLRLQYYIKRKEIILQNIRDSIHKKQEKIRFIEAVMLGNDIGISDDSVSIFYHENDSVSGGKIGHGRKKNAVYEQMDSMNFDRALFKSTSSDQYTEEEILKHRNDIESEISKYEETETTPPEEMWISDIEAFMKAYKRHYKIRD